MCLALDHFVVNTGLKNIGTNLKIMCKFANEITTKNTTYRNKK